MRAPYFVRLTSALRHQWRIVVCILSVGCVAAALTLVAVHPKYAATTTVLMVAEPPEDSNPSVPSTATKPLLSTDLPALATSDTVLRRFRDDIGESVTFDKLKSRIRAKVSTDSTVMPVQYTANSSDRAIRGANLLGAEIVRFYRETATARFDSLIMDFTRQMAVRRSELARFDRELARLATGYPYIDVTAPGTPANGSQSVYDRLIAMVTESAQTHATLDADTAAAMTTARLVSDAKPLAARDIVDNDVAYRGIRDQYAKDLTALKKLSTFGSDRYPGVAELRAIVARDASLTAQARQAALGAGPASNQTYVAALDAQAKADAIVASDQAKARSEDTAIERLHAQIRQSNIAIDVARLRRDRENAETAYSTIASRLAKAVADRAEAASTGSVIVLDHAQSAPKALFDSGIVIAAAILFMTVWISVTIAVMVDGSQEWFDEASSVESVYGTRLIGSIA